MIVVLFLLFAGEPTPHEVAYVVTRPICEKMADALNANVKEPGVRFGCYERAPKVQRS
jgi:uncharacterized membrane-anchored protein